MIRFNRRLRTLTGLLDEGDVSRDTNKKVKLHNVSLHGLNIPIIQLRKLSACLQPMMIQC